MVPIPKIIWSEHRATTPSPRVIEPEQVMEQSDQVDSYVEAYAAGGPTAALQLHHVKELTLLIRPGDAVLDLACGPGPLLLELALIYPDVRFVGADLSATMLDHLERQAKSRDLANVAVVRDDIRTLTSIGDARFDLVISTSALHHLPDENSLREVLRRVRSVLRPNGGFYMFDFALLKSDRTRKLFVSDLARSAPPLTVHDYALSLKAAFPLDVVLRLAEEELPKPFSAFSSAFVDFCFFLQSPSRTRRTSRAAAHVVRQWASLPVGLKVEHVALRALRRRRPNRSGR